MLCTVLVGHQVLAWSDNCVLGLCFLQDERVLETFIGTVFFNRSWEDFYLPYLLFDCYGYMNNKCIFRSSWFVMHTRFVCCFNSTFFSFFSLPQLILLSTSKFLKTLYCWAPPLRNKDVPMLIQYYYYYYYYCKDSIIGLCPYGISFWSLVLKSVAFIIHRGQGLRKSL
jgi:hypothetical protein